MSGLVLHLDPLSADRIGEPRVSAFVAVLKWIESRPERGELHGA